MKPVWRNLAVALVVLVGLGSQARAQLMGPMGGLPVSPYLNLFRGGAPPAINYFNLVQPQLQFNDAIGQLGLQQSVLGQEITSQANRMGMMTGHPVAFGNTSHYYNYRGMRGMGGMGMGGMGMGGMGMGGMGMGGMGMGGMGMGGMGMGGMGMGGMGMGGMGMGGMGMGGMGMGGMGMGGMGMGMGR